MDIFDLAKQANDSDFEHLILNERSMPDDIDVVDKDNHSPLYYAIEKGHIKMTQYLLARGVTLKNDKYTPFLLATYHGHVELAKMLYSEQHLEERDVYGNTPLMNAAMNGHTPMVEWLLGLGAEINAINDHGDSALYMALRYQHLQTANALLEREDIITDHANIMSYTPFVIALVNGDFDLVNKLYTADFDLNKRYTENNTLLHICALAGNVAATQWLLDHGANPQLKNSFGLGPMEQAALNNQIALIALFIEKIKHNHQFNKDLGWVLLIAANHGYEDLFDVVLSHKHKFPEMLIQATLLFASTRGHWNLVAKLLDLNPGKAKGRINKHYDYGDFKYNHGNTILHAAATNGHLDVVKNLIDRGARVNARNHNHDSVLHAAVLGGNLAVIRFLCGKMDVNQQNRQGTTPLHIAVETNNEAAIRCLLLNGADFTIKNHQNQSAQYLAKRQPELDRCFKEFLERDFTKFGLQEIHTAVALKEDKALLQILAVVHDLNSLSEDGLTPVQFAAHLGDVNPLVILLLWQSKCDKQAAQKLALELKTHYPHKSTAHTALGKAAQMIKAFPENRLHDLLAAYSTYEAREKPEVLNAFAKQDKDISAAGRFGFFITAPRESQAKDEQESAAYEQTQPDSTIVASA